MQYNGFIMIKIQQSFSLLWICPSENVNKNVKWKKSVVTASYLFPYKAKGPKPYSSCHKKCPMDVSPRTSPPTHRNANLWQLLFNY